MIQPLFNSNIFQNGCSRPSIPWIMEFRSKRIARGDEFPRHSLYAMYRTEALAHDHELQNCLGASVVALWAIYRDEIDSMIKLMPADRHRGLTGLVSRFWNLLGTLSDTISTSCALTFMMDLQSINTGYITLIPTTASPETANDYRPSTLLNCCLKVIMKILANRLQRLILRIIHRNQYDFFNGRTIQDCLEWAFVYLPMSSFW